MEGSSQTAMDQDEIWRKCDGLPAHQGKDHPDITTQGINTIEAMKNACMRFPDCMGFAFRPAQGTFYPQVWFPKKSGTGFDPDLDTDFFPHASNEKWEWHYRVAKAWKCIHEDGVIIRSQPDFNSTLKGKLDHSHIFKVSKRLEQNVEGLSITFLELADGRGWVSDRHPNLGVVCELWEAEAADIVPGGLALQAAQIGPDDTVQWMWGDAGFLGHDVARRDPLRWSWFRQLGATIVDLRKQDQKRKVEIRTERAMKLICFESVEEALLALHEQARPADVRRAELRAKEEGELRLIAEEEGADDIDSCYDQPNSKEAVIALIMKQARIVATNGLDQLLQRPWKFVELSQQIENATNAGVNSSHPSLANAMQQMAFATKWNEMKPPSDIRIEERLKRSKSLVAETWPANFVEVGEMKNWCEDCIRFLQDLPKTMGPNTRLTLLMNAEDLGLSEHPDVKNVIDIGKLLGEESDVFMNAEPAMKYWLLVRQSGNQSKLSDLSALHVSNVLVKQAIKPDELLKQRNKNLFDDRNVKKAGINFVAHGLLKFRSPMLYQPSLALDQDKLDENKLDNLIAEPKINATEFVCVHKCAEELFNADKPNNIDPIRKFVLFKFYQGVVWHCICTYGLRLQRAQHGISELRKELSEVQNSFRMNPQDHENDDKEAVDCAYRLNELGKQLAVELGREDDLATDKAIQVEALQTLFVQVGRRGYFDQQDKLIKHLRRSPPDNSRERDTVFEQDMLMAVAVTIADSIEDFDNRARKFEASIQKFADTLFRLKNTDVYQEQGASTPARRPRLECDMPIGVKTAAIYEHTELTSVIDEEIHKFLNLMTGRPVSSGSICDVEEYFFVMENDLFKGSEADAHKFEALVRGHIEDALVRSLKNYRIDAGGIMCNNVLLRAWLFDFLRRRQRFDTYVCSLLRKLSKQTDEPGWAILLHALPRDVTIALTRACDEATKKLILPLMQEIGMAIPIYYVWCDEESIKKNHGDRLLQGCTDLTALDCCDIETAWVVNIGTDKTRGKTKLLQMLYGMEDNSISQKKEPGLNHLHHLHDTTLIDMIPAWKVDTFKITVADVHNFSLSKATEAGVWRSIASLSKYNHITILQLSANDFQGIQASEDVMALISRILKVSHAKVLCFFRDYQDSHKSLVNDAAKLLQDQLQEKFVGLWTVQDIKEELESFRNAELTDFLDSWPQHVTIKTESKLRQFLTTEPLQMFKVAMERHHTTMHHGVHTTFEEFSRGLQRSRPAASSYLSPSTESAENQQTAVSLLAIRRKLKELLRAGSSDKDFSQKLFPCTLRNVKLEAVKKERIAKDKERTQARGAGLDKNREIQKSIEALEAKGQEIDRQCLATPPHQLMVWFGRTVANRDFDKIKELGNILYEWRLSNLGDANLSTLENLLRKKKDIQIKLDDRTESDGPGIRNALEDESKKLEKEIKALRAKTDQYNISVDSFWHELMFRCDIRRHDSQYTKMQKFDDTEMELDALIDCYRAYLGLGNSTHFLHGDPLYFGTSTPNDKGGQVAQDFIGSLLRRLDTSLSIGSRKILVISVIGIQSSGKSTLMNYIFGCSFATSVGRCTTGMFFSILETETEVVLVLDTEGLLSVEARSGVFDKQVSLMTIACSDLVIINNRGELSAAVQELFTVCMFALEQMKDLRNPEARPKLVFILQCVTDVSTTMKKKWLTDVKGKLMEAVDTLRKRSGSSKVSLGDLIDLQDDAIFTLPMTFHEEGRHLGRVRKYNGIYSDLALKLRNDLLFICKSKPRVARTFSDWYKHAKQVWDTLESVGEEIMHFKDAYQIKQALQLEDEVQNIIKRMEDDMSVRCRKINNDVEAKLKSCNSEADVDAALVSAKALLENDQDLAINTMEESFESFAKDNNIQDPILKIQQKRKLYHPAQLLKGTFVDILEHVVNNCKVELIVNKQNKDVLAKVVDAVSRMLDVSDCKDIDEKRLNEIVDQVAKGHRYQETFSIIESKIKMLEELEGRFSQVASRNKGQKLLTSKDVQDLDKNNMSALWKCAKADSMREIGVQDIFQKAYVLAHCESLIADTPYHHGVSTAAARIVTSHAARQSEQGKVAAVFRDELRKLFENVQAMLTGRKGIELLDCLPNAYKSTVETCENLGKYLEKDHPTFMLNRSYVGFTHAIGTIVAWFIWYSVVYSQFKEFSERMKKAETDINSIKQQVSAAYRSGATDKEAAFVLAGMFGKTITTSIGQASAEGLASMYADMQMCQVPPEIACKIAIQQSFGKGDFHACLQYCIDTTKYIKMMFNEDVIKGQKRVEGSQGDLIMKRCEFVRDAVFRLVDKWKDDPKTDSTVDALLEAIKKDESRDAPDEKSLALLKQCGHAAIVPKLTQKKIEGRNKSAFAAGFKQKFDMEIGKEKMKDTVDKLVKTSCADWANKRWLTVQGCTHRCPKCGSKCSSPHPDHLCPPLGERQATPHICEFHMIPCINGWGYEHTHHPCFGHCREQKSWDEGVVTYPKGERYVYPNFLDYLQDHYPDWLDNATNKPPKGNEPQLNYAENNREELEQLQAFWAVAKHAIMKIPKCSHLVLGPNQEWEERARKNFKTSDWGEEAYNKAKKELDDVVMKFEA